LIGGSIKFGIRDFLAGPRHDDRWFVRMRERYMTWKHDPTVVWGFVAVKW